MERRNKRKKQFQREGTLFVISAPSGAGKSTLCQKLLRKKPWIKLSVSYTTRSPRKGEINDVHYTFISEKKFKGMIARKEFAFFDFKVAWEDCAVTSIKKAMR